MLTWTAAERILKTFPYLWIATTDDDGRPHLVQQWGVWGDATLWFEGSVRTRWARNLARRYAAKYGPTFKYRPKPDQYEKGPIFRARPEKLVAFDVKKFNTSAARFTFSG